MTDYTWKEMMAVLFAREIEDGDRVTAGAHTEIFFAATLMAQKTHAPNLKLQLGGTCFLCNVTDIDIEHLPKTSTDYSLLRYAESVHDHPETFLFYCPPGREKYYEDNSPYRDTNHFWFADRFFVGGIQVDKFGNANMIGLGKGGKLDFRGPGSVGINDIANTVRCPYVFVTAHDKRRLVEQVDYISFPGRKICKEVEFLASGPKWIVTPLCIFDFDPKTDEARLAALLPGSTVEQVKENTGFEVNVSAELHTIEPPTSEELNILRNEVDRTGVLRH
jgi:glutaconate CoA-transferase subunit B